VVGLSEQLTDNVCQQLAIKLEMFCANIEKLFEYELTDLDKVEKLCGVDFLTKEQLSIIKRTCGYEDTLICIKYPLLNNSDILSVIKNNCLLIYLSVSQKYFDYELDKNEESKAIRIIEKEAFEDRDYLCKKMADIVVDYDDENMSDFINKIIEKIVEFYS
jgi:shikimate kinase